MNKFIKVVTGILVFLFLIICCYRIAEKAMAEEKNCVDFCFVNNTDKIVAYNLFQLDFPEPGKKFNRAGGEVLPGVKDCLNVSYPPGRYVVSWWNIGVERKDINYKRIEFTAFPDMRIILLRTGLIFYQFPKEAWKEE